MLATTDRLRSRRLTGALLLATCLAARANAQELLLDVNPSGSSNPSGFVLMDGITYFGADDGTNGRELWRSDGTAAGTWMVADIDPGSASSTPASMIVFGGKLFFIARSSGFGAELWSSDGTAAGTAMVADIRPGNGSPLINKLVPAGDRIYFAANDGTHGTELWSSDGTTAGTTLARDIRPGSTTSQPQGLAAHGDVLLFQADDGVNGRELWRSDGTESGTELLVDIAPGSAFSTTYNYASFRGRTWFACWTQATGNELWSSDGTAAGTQLVIDLRPNSSSDSMTSDQMVVFDDALWFVGNDGSGLRLWRTDGTAAGTVPATTTTTGTLPRELTVVGDRLYFVAYNAISGVDLWYADADGTATSLGQIHPYGIMEGQALRAAGSDLFFIGQDDTTQQDRLWRSDGTTQGTMPIGTANGADYLFAARGRLWLSAWTSNGVSEPHLLATQTATAYGSGCAGSVGYAPRIGYRGSVRLGNAFVTTLQDAAPSSIALLLVGDSRGEFALPPAGACNLLLGSILATPAAPIDLVGHTEFPVAVPNTPSLVDATLQFQWAVLEQDGPALGLAALSGGLEMTIGQ